MNNALGLVETKGLVGAIEAADAMGEIRQRAVDWLRKNWLRADYRDGPRRRRRGQSRR